MLGFGASGFIGLIFCSGQRLRFKELASIADPQWYGVCGGCSARGILIRFIAIIRADDPVHDNASQEPYWNGNVGFDHHKCN